MFLQLSGKGGIFILRMVGGLGFFCWFFRFLGGFFVLMGFFFFLLVSFFLIGGYILVIWKTLRFSLFDP